MRKQLDLFDEFITICDPILTQWDLLFMDWSCVVYVTILEFQLHVWLKNWNWLYIWTRFDGRCAACLISGLWMVALLVILYFMTFETIAELRGLLSKPRLHYLFLWIIELEAYPNSVCNVARSFKLGCWSALRWLTICEIFGGGWLDIPACFNNHKLRTVNQKFFMGMFGR